MRPVRRRLDFTGYSPGDDVSASLATHTSNIASNGVNLRIIKSKPDIVDLTSQSPERGSRSSPRKLEAASGKSDSGMGAAESPYLIQSAAHVLPCSVSQCPECMETRTCDTPLPSPSHSSPSISPKRDTSVTPKKDASTSPKAPPATPRKGLRGTPRRDSSAKQTPSKTMKNFYTSIKKQCILSVGKDSDCSAGESSARDARTSLDASTADLAVPMPADPPSFAIPSASASPSVASGRSVGNPSVKATRQGDIIKKTKSPQTGRRKNKECKGQKKMDSFFKNFR